MNKFSFMTPMEGKNWFTHITKLYGDFGTWDPEIIHPFERNYGGGINYDSYLHTMKLVCEKYVDDTTGKDIYTLLEEGDGTLPLWDYERLCSHIGEEPFLLQEAGKLKYFFGKYPARILEHVDTVLNALRYRYHSGRSNSVARYRTGNLPNISREWDYDTANAYWKNKILESWNADTWEYVDYPTDRPYYWVQNKASYYYGVDEDPETIGGYMQAYSYSWGFVPRFVSRVYIFGKVDKINESEPPTRVSELKNDGFYPGLPEDLEEDKWYEIITADFRASEHERDFQYTEYRGLEKMPTIPDLPRYAEDINTFHTYERGCEWSKTRYVLDIRPDRPPTLEGLT